MEHRGNFGSKLGIVLATAGSAVGLGNVWRFPYMTGQNGGAAFLLLYIACILILGVPGMISEFIVGRHAQTNAARAYNQLSGGRPWRYVGYLGILTSTIILGFYAVVAGWCLHYLYVSILGHMHGDANYVQEVFTTFSGDLWEPVVCGIFFILLTHLVVVRGIRKGIEKASKWLMPILLVLLLILVVASCLLPGATDGIRFLLSPDFSKIDSEVLLEALGQAFFSLSLGTACLCTYASYFTKETNLLYSAGQIAFLDTFIAILSGLLIFPAAASVGISADSGPALIFITLPNVFEQAFGSMPVVQYVVSLAFYILLSIAALTSNISLHEVSTSFLSEELRIGRRKAATFVSLMCVIVGAFCSLSLGGWEWAKLFGMPFFDLFDWFTANICLPLGGFFTCLFIGWFVEHKIIHDEITNWGTSNYHFFHLFVFVVKYICPLFILFIFLHQLGWV